MRNLKRALSLTLASVMLLGMMVVGASAAGYPDVDEEDNVEAIEVLKAVKVMVGDENGNFDPDRNVTRTEMAVVMALLLDLDYEYYEASCPFWDVPTWARGYVGACYANKTIYGYNATTYGAADSITPVQAAAMMMRALGYFQYPEDTKDGFELSTVRQGSEIGIFDGVGSSATAPMTRNQVAKMALNALQSEMVAFTGTPGTQYTASSGETLSIGYRAEYTPRTSTELKYNAIEGRTSDVATEANHKGQYYIQLGEQLYNGKLRLNKSAYDEFGRPSRRWEYDGEEVGTYAKTELIRKSYTSEVTGRELYDLLGSTTVENYPHFLVCVDGVYDWDASNHTAFDRSAVNRANDQGVGGTGKGVLTQVFVDSDKKAVDIAIINTYLAFTDEDYDDRTDDIDITVYGIKEYNSSNEYYKSCNTADSASTDEGFKLDVKDFPQVEAMKKDQPLLATVAQGEVQTIAEPEVLSAVEITSFKQGSWVVSGGEQYDFASATEYDCDTLEAYTDTIINLKDMTYDIYLDKYGYLIGVVEVEAADNYVFITGVDTNTNNRFNNTVDASGIFIDGTMDGGMEVNYNKCDDDAKLELEAGTKGDHMINKWYTYTKDNDNRYVLKAITTNTSNTFTGKVGQAHTAQGTTGTPFKAEEISKKQIALSGGATTAGKWSKVYGNDASVYLIAELTEIKNAADARTIIISGVESMITGVDNANIDIWSDANILTASNVEQWSGNLSAADIDGDDNTYGTRDDVAANGVYTLFDDDGYVIAAVVVGEDEGVAANLVYAHTGSLESETLNKEDTKAAKAGEYTWTRKVISKGEEILLTEVGSGLSELKNMSKYNWYEVKFNGDGEVRKVEHVSSALVGSERVTSLTGGALDTAMADKDTVLLDITSASTTPNYDKRTFYTDTTDSESGFRVASDAKIVFIQTNNNKETVKYLSGADDLKDVVKKLHSDGGYEFDVGAIMERYEATFVVVYDRNKSGNSGNAPSDDGIIGTPMSGTTYVEDINAELAAGRDVTITEPWQGLNRGNKQLVIPGGRTLKFLGNLNLTSATTGGAANIGSDDYTIATIGSGSHKLIVTGRFVVSDKVSSTIGYDIEAGAVSFIKKGSNSVINVNGTLTIKGDGTNGTGTGADMVAGTNMTVNLNGTVTVNDTVSGTSGVATTDANGSGANKGKFVVYGHTEINGTIKSPMDVFSSSTLVATKPAEATITIKNIGSKPGSFVGTTEAGYATKYDLTSAVTAPVTLPALKPGAVLIINQPMKVSSVPAGVVLVVKDDLTVAGSIATKDIVIAANKNIILESTASVTGEAVQAIKAKDGTDIVGSVGTEVKVVAGTDGLATTKTAADAAKGDTVEGDDKLEIQQGVPAKGEVKPATTDKQPTNTSLPIKVKASDISKITKNLPEGAVQDISVSENGKTITVTVKKCIDMKNETVKAATFDGESLSEYWYKNVQPAPEKIIFLNITGSGKVYQYKSDWKTDTEGEEVWVERDLSTEMDKVTCNNESEIKYALIKTGEGGAITTGSGTNCKVDPNSVITIKIVWDDADVTPANTSAAAE